MNIDYEAFNTILYHTTLREIKNSFKDVSFPLVNLDHNHEILGILNEQQFWKGGALEDWDEKVDLYIDYDFRVYDS